MAESDDDHVRVSEETKAWLGRRKREDESYNEFIVRLLDDDRDSLGGFGAGSERAGETLAETVVRRKERSSRRIEAFAEGREEDEV